MHGVLACTRTIRFQQAAAMGGWERKIRRNPNLINAQLFPSSRCHPHSPAYVHAVGQYNESVSPADTHTRTTSLAGDVCLKCSGDNPQRLTNLISALKRKKNCFCSSPQTLIFKHLGCTGLSITLKKLCTEITLVIFHYNLLPPPKRESY